MKRIQGPYTFSVPKDPEQMIVVKRDFDNRISIIPKGTNTKDDQILFQGTHGTCTRWIAKHRNEVSITTNQPKDLSMESKLKRLKEHFGRL